MPKNPKINVTEHQLGDAPIQQETRDLMVAIASGLDEFLNPDQRGPERKWGFMLLVFPFRDHEGRANYISNGANREDIVVLLKEQIARFEGQPEVQGTA